MSESLPDEIEVFDSPYPLNGAGDDAVSSSDADREPDPERVPELEGLSEDAPDGEDGGPSLRGMGSHLDELRRRLIVSLSVFAPLFILGMILYRTLWDVIVHPLERAAPHLLRFQALGPSDGLVMAMRISFAFALFLSLPVWLGQIWHFVSPGLTTKEKRWLHLSLGSGTVLFVLGAALAYFIGVPLALEFLLPFNQTLTGWENAFTGPGYVDFVITCCAGFGIAFELPLVMLALGWAGILTTDTLRQWWRPILLLIVVLAAIMTPPDPFTQCMLAIPMVGLFGIGWILVGWVNRE